MGLGNVTTENATLGCICKASLPATHQSPAVGGFYDVQAPDNITSHINLIVCFRDGFSDTDIARAHQIYDSDTATDVHDKRCQPCPDCSDCSRAGELTLQPGYISIAGSTPGGDHHAFLCDASTSVTLSDEANFRYITSAVSQRFSVRYTR